MAHKLRLTRAYIDRFLEHYRSVRYLLHQEIKDLSLDSDSRVAIIGTSELSELAYLALRDIGVTSIEVFEVEVTRERFLGMQVQPLSSLESGRYTQVVLPSLNDSTGSRIELITLGVPESRVVELLDSRQARLAETGSRMQDVGQSRDGKAPHRDETG
jgi:hypothetical protein